MWSLQHQWYERAFRMVCGQLLRHMRSLWLDKFMQSIIATVTITSLFAVLNHPVI